MGQPQAVPVARQPKGRQPKRRIGRTKPVHERHQFIKGQDMRANILAFVFHSASPLGGIGQIGKPQKNIVELSGITRTGIDLCNRLNGVQRQACLLYTSDAADE